MARVSLALLFVAAMVGATLALPAAEGDHCRTKIVVFGRSGFVPAPAPPHASSAPCVDSRPGDAVNPHVLPPLTDQVFVRVNGDFGAGVSRLSVVLEGLGFQGQSFTLHRGPTPTGGFAYQLSEWVPLPNGTQSGDLNATVQFPSLTARVTYSTLD